MSDHVAEVTLCNPPANALGAEVDRELGACFGALAQRDPAVCCAVLTGAGRCFSAGTDLRETLELSGEQAVELPRIANGVLNLIEASPFPVIAAVNGPALGGGLELVLCCDFAIASERASFGFPEVTIGAMPVYGGTQRLPRAVGMALAKRMAYTGQPLDAQAALRASLVLEVTEPEELLPRAREIARTIAANAPAAARACKWAMAGALETPLAEGLETEARESLAVFSSSDRDEGVAAFLQKRAPCFRDL